MSKKMTKKYIQLMMEDSTYNINGKNYLEIETENGLMNPERLREEKVEFMKYLTSYILEDFLVEKKDYPNSTTDTAMVEIEADFVVLKKEDYNKIVKYIEENE